MKKYLIFLITLFSLLLVPKVSAASYNVSMNSEDFYNSMIATDDYIKSFSYVNQTVLNNFQSSLESRIDTTQYDYIVLFYLDRPYISSSTFQFNVIYFEKNQNVDFYYNFFMNYSQDSYGALYNWIITYSNIDYGVLIYNLKSNNSSYTFSVSKAYQNGISRNFAGSFFRSSSNGIYGTNGLNHSKNTETRLYKTTVPLKYSSNSVSSISTDTIQNLSVIDNDNNDEITILNDTSDYGITFLNSSLEMSFLMPTPPSFLFILNDNRDEFDRLLSVDIRLNIDNYSDNFIIQYVTDDTSGNWITILPEYNELTGYYFAWDNWSYNATIFVRAIYLGNHEVVSSANQEISGIIPSYDSGQVNNYGNNNFGVTSNQVTIRGHDLFNTITCSSQRAFVNNVCYVNNSDILDIQDKLNNRVHVTFYFSMHNINVPYQGDKYYLFSYRSYFDRVLLPYNVSIISGNSINSSTTIIDYNVKEHGLYRDYIILFSSSSSQTLIGVDGVSLIFPSFSTIYDSFPQSFTLGFYNGVKYQQFDTLPTSSDIENFYNNNSLDSLNNGSLLSYFTNFSINDHGLSSVVLKPIDFLNHLTNSTCSPVEFPLPHTDKVLTLPCIRPLFELYLPSVFQLYQLIVSGLIFYRIGIDLFRLIKNLFNPENDKIEVVDL